MSANLLELTGVHTHIGAYHILHGVDFAVPEGGVTMLLGRNGAGKSTTLRTIMGLWPASQGDVRFQGRSLKGVATPDIATQGDNPGGNRFYAKLSARYAQIRPCSDGTRIANSIALLNDTIVLQSFQPAMRQTFEGIATHDPILQIVR